MKKIWIVGLLMVVIVGVSEAVRLGIGYTFDTGLHVRFGKVEAQAIFGEPSIYGARFYAFQTKKDPSFYTGLEANIVSSKVLDGGYVGGAYLGMEKVIWKKLNLNLDLGFYGTGLKGFETVTDSAIVMNTKLTWYFK